MALKKRIQNAYLFENGNLVIFDSTGSQIGELQGAYSIDKHKRILLEAMDDCKFEGFYILPKGFIKHAEDINHFREKNMSWDDIKNSC